MLKPYIELRCPFCNKKETIIIKDGIEKYKYICKCKRKITYMCEEPEKAVETDNVKHMRYTGMTTSSRTKGSYITIEHTLLQR